MRTAARVDANQAEIVAAYRALGCTVQSLAQIGHGCPDLLVADPGGAIHLVEVKDGSQPPSGRALTKDQQDWHRTWNSQVHVVKNVTEALAVVGVEIDAIPNSRESMISLVALRGIV